ncbi:ABC transporter ATP-binding protein [Candidatus Poriferisocius sp.]|uniref:ABC transporter ATP-binding protein n=1 Tax=Candidatus Poriferisocius sp. TaxID=3101276 RepID=UPI003B0154A7
MEDTPIVKIRNLQRTFSGDTPVQVLRGVDITICHKEYVSLIGPSGSGKSTLLYIVGLLESASQGTYFLDGLNIDDLDDVELTTLRSQKIGFIFQHFYLLEHRTVLDNVILPLLYRKQSRASRVQAAKIALKEVGLEKHAKVRPNTLSGGEQQRVAIARAIVGNPSLLLADEPTGNLDQSTGKDVLDIFENLRDRGLTILLVTHDLDIAKRADRILQVNDGIVQDYN